MSISSIPYVVFLLIAGVVHYYLPVRYRNGLLLVLSLVFLGLFDGVTLGIALLSGTISYVAARWMEQVESREKKKPIQFVSISLLVLILCFYKYSGIWGLLLKEPIRLLTPVGLSFYTFQAIGYLVDVGNGRIPAEANYLDWLLSVTFFPQFVSGPIARSGRLLEQLHERTVSTDDMVIGLRRYLIGAMAKIALADGLGILVDGMYNHLGDRGGLSVTMAMFLYPLQIYFDFSGYTAMAIGSARMFGVHLQENFLAPYFSTGIGEIWKRWHITLSEWFRDYLYFPLGGSRKGEGRTLVNLGIVFVVSALWHGTTTTNLLWGAVMVASRFLERFFTKGKPTVEKTGIALWLNRLGIYLWWMMTLVPFRMPDVASLVQMLKAQLQPGSVSSFLQEVLQVAANEVSNTKLYYLIFFGCLFVGLAIHFWMDYVLDRSLKGEERATDPFAGLSGWKRWVLYWVMGFITAAMYIITQTGGGPSFIYQGF